MKREAWLARQAPALPMEWLLPKVDVLFTHTVNQALSFGIPIAAAGRPGQS